MNSLIRKTISLTAVALLLGTAFSGHQSSAQQSENESAAFQPIIESEMPEGFPDPTPVGEVEVKSYPVYRKAESGGGFWTLFMHIKKKDIPMTAPVELDYNPGESESYREGNMSFLYGDPEWGEAGQDGRVEVADVPEMTVVSIGVRGRRSNSTVAAAHARIEEWLEENIEQYSSAGELRVMAYNSPFVPERNRYFEVQVPIQSNEANEAE
jgi:hypothetical protein